MPVRGSDPELDFETREYVQGKKITRTVAQWKESDRIIAEITDWNNEIEKLSLDLQKELRDEYSTDGIKEDLTIKSYVANGNLKVLQGGK